MEKNCLVTKLKTAVNNSELEKLGVLSCRLANPAYYSSILSSQQDFSTIEDEQSILTISGGTLTVTSPNIKNSDTEAIIKHGGKLAVTGDSSVKYFDAEITNKYALEKLYYLYGCDSSDFKYISNLNKLYTMGISGSIPELIENIPNIVDLYLNSGTGIPVSLSGKISHLIGYIKGLTYFFIGQTTNAELCTFEEAVAIRRGLGQTSSTGNGVRIQIQNQSMSFNGVYTSHSQKYLTWTPTTITLGSETINNDDVANV